MPGGWNETACMTYEIVFSASPGSAHVNDRPHTDAPDKPAGWIAAGGVFTVRAGSGDIQIRRLFTDYQIHLEWRVPASMAGSGQARGNSGLFLASTGKGSLRRASPPAAPW